MHKKHAKSDEPRLAETTIYDRQGRSYRCFIAKWADFCRFDVKDKAMLAAEATCSLVEVYNWRIDNLFVANQVHRSQSLWRDLFGWKPPAVNFRRRGIGSALLALIIDELRKNGAKQITGSIVDRDVQANPNLLD